MRVDYRAALIAAVTGLLLATVVAGAATFIDWYANPGGVFRSPGGTQWSPLLETFVSWFWPFALLSLPVATVCFVAARSRGIRASQQQER